MKKNKASLIITFSLIFLFGCQDKEITKEKYYQIEQEKILEDSPWNCQAFTVGLSAPITIEKRWFDS